MPGSGSGTEETGDAVKRRWVIFRTPLEKATGLQFMKSIPKDTVFLFPDVAPGSEFHSRNVPEPFELYFMSEGDDVLHASVVTPPHETRRAPPGTYYALEARPGTLQGLSPHRS